MSMSKSYPCRYLRPKYFGLLVLHGTETSNHSVILVTEDEKRSKLCRLDITLHGRGASHDGVAGYVPDVRTKKSVQSALSQTMKRNSKFFYN